jgi:tetratricopeptide (TPR) repeat protein
MKKEFLIVIAASFGLMAFLMMRPKVVVSNAKESLPKASAASRDKPSKETSTMASHSRPMDAEQQQKVDALKAKLAAASTDKKAGIIENLMLVFSEANRIDSAAKYAEGLLAIDNSDLNLLKVADTYYQAYGFALTENKGKELGEKARDFYQKALDKNPALLKAKTNMAMTYVTTETPMAGILLLREVLNDDPNYEPALMNIGLLSMQSNQFEKASLRFRTIIKNNPKNTQAEFYLGICLAEMGEKTEARKYLESVQKKDNDPAIQQAVKETLQNLK